MERAWTVSADQAGERLDLHLAQQLGISRAQARRLLERGELRCAQRARLAKGELVQVGWEFTLLAAFDAGEELPAPRPDLPLRVLAEDENWIAVDKPPGQGVHPLHGGQVDTLLNAAIARYPELAGAGERPLRGGIVHRLDVDTSGLLLLARNAASYRRLREAFRGHRVRKQYLALVEGRMEGELDLRLDLVIAQRRPARVRVADPTRSGGRGRRRCRTWIQALRPGPTQSLVEARPVSGYLHQIRVSLSHCGHPVCGDRIYGQSTDRLWLHAWKIQLPDLGIDVACPPDPGFGPFASGD